jgi:pimeloyl-ACP methyl ester carboxylesterase
MSSVELGFIRLADGLRLRYRCMEADGPTVLLLHGWPESGHAWRRVMPSLAASGFFPLAPDLRGCGDSDKPTGGYDALTRMEDVRALVATLGVGDDPIFVAGHGDEGAEVANAYAVSHPEEVAGLAVLSATPGGMAGAGGPHVDWHGDFHHTPDLPELLIAPHLEAYLRHFFRAWSHDPDMLHDSDLAVYVRALSAPGALRASLAPFRVPLLPPGINPDIPLLLLMGESDPRLDPVALDTVLAEHHGQARLETIPRGGYWLPEERPDPVAAALLTFFRGQHPAGLADAALPPPL